MDSFVVKQAAGVLHDKELTYSVIVSEDHPNMPKQLQKRIVLFRKVY